MKNKEGILSVVMSVSLILMLVVAFLPLVKIHWFYAPFVFAFGAAGTLIARIFEVYKGSSIRIKRLYRMGKVSAMCYCVSAFLMFYKSAGPQDWLAFLTAGAVLQLYVNFMVPHAEKKEREEAAKAPKK